MNATSVVHHLPENRYADAQRRADLFGELTRRVSAIPGVQSGTMVSSLPGVGAMHLAFALERATGARASDVMRMVLRQDLIQVGVGTVIGLALATAQLLIVIMFDVQPRDPAVFGGVVAVLAATALVACVLPARRATRVHHTEALRHE